MIKAQSTDGYEKTETVQLTDGYGFTDLYDISKDGSLALYKNRAGMLKVIHFSSEEIIKSTKSGGSRFVFFSNNSKRLINFYKNGFGVQNIYDQTPESYVSSGEQGFLFSAYKSFGSDEYLLPAKVDPDKEMNNKIRISDYATGKNYYINPGKYTIDYACITQDESYIFLLSDDLTLLYFNTSDHSLRKITTISPGFKKIIAGPEGKYCLIMYPLNSEVISADRGRTVMYTNNDVYLRFSPDGSKLMTLDTAHHVNIWNLDIGKKILNIYNPRFSNFSSTGKLVCFYINSEVNIFDLESERYVLKKPFPNISQFKISQDEEEFLVLRMASVEVYNTQTGDLNAHVKTNAYGGILNAMFDINGNVITQSSGILSLWEPQLVYEPGISEYFRIISPKPNVLREFNAGEQEINTSREIIIRDLIKNNTPYPIKIVSIQTENDGVNFGMISGNHSFILEPGDSHDVEIFFQPNSIGAILSRILVSTPDSVYICTLTGIGVKEKYIISGKTIDFGSVFVGMKKDTTIYITNETDQLITISQVENSGPDTEQFGIKNDIQILPPHKSTPISLFYEAGKKGMSSGSITLHIEKFFEPIRIQMIGQGALPGKLTIYGYTKDITSQEPLPSKWFCTNSESNEILYSDSTGKDGFYSFTIEYGNSLLLYAEKEKYVSNSEYLNLTNLVLKDSIRKDIYLSEIIQGSTIRLQGIFFEFAKSEILPKSFHDLNRVIKLLISNPEFKIEVHGHTDYIGSEEDNLKLSEKRAMAVMDFLANHGIDSSRINIKYHGELNPIGDNQTEEGRQMNRRVEFVLVK